MLASALGWPGSKARRIIELCWLLEIEMLTSFRLVREFLWVIEQPRFAFVSDFEKSNFLRDLFTWPRVITPKLVLHVIREDPSDDRVLECAVDGGADYIVTSDYHLLAEDIPRNRHPNSPSTSEKTADEVIP